MAEPGSQRLDITITDGRGRAVRAPGLAAWLARVAPARARGDLSIALVGDARIKALNRQYRGKDVVTDVLSFEPGSDDSAQVHPSSRHLGDIAIATGVARRQARDAGHSYAVELKVLALHGLLHLLGYDHEHVTDRGRMARVERRLRLRGGLRLGLIERAAAPPRPLRSESPPHPRPRSA